MASKKDLTKLIEVKLPSDSLQIGMHVSRLDRPWTEVPLLLQGLTIGTKEDIDILRSHCIYVYIEIEEEFLARLKQGSSENKVYPGFRETVEFRDELPKAKLAIDEVRGHVDEVLASISGGDVFDLEVSRKVIQSCTQSILSNANALICLTQIKKQNYYTAEHCLRVAILAMAFGRYVGCKKLDIELLGLCGMLHDVGKMKIPSAVLDKPGKLTPEEFETIKLHPLLGKEFLDKVGGIDPLVVKTAYYHHERIDGKGYPEQVCANYLHRFIRMVSIVDVYDAITSSRCYSKGLSAFEALKILFSIRGVQLDADLVEAFIRMIGIYPPGTLVEMTNGEVAIVVSSNAKSRLRPNLELILTRDKKKRPSHVINLVDEPRDQSDNPYVIKKGLENGSYGVEIKNYLLT